MEKGRWVSGICFVDHGPPLFLNFMVRLSPLCCLVFLYDAKRGMPSISKKSEKAIYLQLFGRSSSWSVPLQRPRRRNLTFPEVGSRCSSHPEAASKRRVSFSTSENSAIDVIAGLQSSAYPDTLYRSSLFGRGGCSGSTGPSVGVE